MDLRVHVRTKIRYDYSFIESAAVQIGEDVLEVASFGSYAVNGVDTPYLGGKAARIGGHNLYHTQENKKSHQFTIALNHLSGENITLSTFKDLVSVVITDGNSQHFGTSQGLMGSFAGEMLGRDGVTTFSKDLNAFGQEWQVNDKDPQLFRYARAPQYPQKCNLPSASTSRRRRLGEVRISKLAAEKACSHVVAFRRAACLQDVIAVGDVEIAKTGAY